MPPSLTARRKIASAVAYSSESVREPLALLIGIIPPSPNDANIVVREWLMYARYLNLRHVTRNTVLRAHWTARGGEISLPFFAAKALPLPLRQHHVK